jgi:hypothetical protein
MKHVIYTGIVMALGLVVVPVGVLAATTMSFTPSEISVVEGQTFTLTVGINPQGEKNYTTKTEVRYSANMLEATSFTFAEKWIPLAQPGYDSINNTAGVLIKTAGYPGGVSSPTPFGTVLFRAKQSGKATITLHENSFSFDAVSKNVLNGTAQIDVTVTESQPVVQGIPQVQQPLVPIEQSQSPLQQQPAGSEDNELADGDGEGDEGEQDEGAVLVEDDVQDGQGVPVQSLLAQVVTLGTGNMLVGIGTGIVVLGGAGYVWYKTRKKKQGNGSNMPS